MTDPTPPSPPPTDPDALVLLTKFSHAHDAELAATALETAGIPALVQQGHGAIVAVGPWVTLWVQAKDRESARDLLEDDTNRIDLTPELEAEEVELARQTKIHRGELYLLFVAVWHFLFGTLAWTAIPAIRRALSAESSHDIERYSRALTDIQLTAALLYCVAALYVVLYILSRESPLPALFIGFGIFVLMQILGVLALVGFARGFLPEWVAAPIWTLFFSAIWIVAIREALKARRKLRSSQIAS